MLTERKHRIDITIELLLLIVFCITIIGCSSSPSSPSVPASLEENKKEVNTSLNACELLDKSIIEKVIGGAIADSKEVMSDAGSAKTPAISQCTYYSGNRYIGILVQRDPRKDVNPHSKEEYMKKMNEGFLIGLEEDVKKEIVKGAQVSGLGDLAFSWNYISYNLIVFWKGNYTLTISVFGREDLAGVLEDEKMMAVKIMEKLK